MSTAGTTTSSTDRIPISDGMLGLPERPGLGTRLRDGFAERPNARVEVTTEENLKAW